MCIRDSYVLCPDCGKHINVFGDSHVDETGKKYHLPVLAKICLLYTSFRGAGERRCSQFYSAAPPQTAPLR